jgi:hypothetical protein
MCQILDWRERNHKKWCANVDAPLDHYATKIVFMDENDKRIYHLAKLKKDENGKVYHEDKWNVSKHVVFEARTASFESIKRNIKKEDALDILESIAKYHEKIGDTVDRLDMEVSCYDGKQTNVYKVYPSTD